MRKFLYIVLSIALLAMVMHLCSCAGGGSIDPTDPILPALDLTEGTVDPITRAITVTKEDITVVSEHWSRTRLNRKYTTVDTRSPFYYLEIWEQAYKSEAFHVTITNNTPRNVVFSFKDSIMEDEREYEYNTITDIQDLRYRFVTKRLMDLRTKKALELAPQIMLVGKLHEGNTIPPGQTVDGFLLYTTPSTIAEKVWLNVVVEKEPESRTAAYEKVRFRFPYTQDRVLLKRQPPMKRS
ncbi:hypothetical protein ACFL6S_33550 [Candidatus Poribacteria bacterium]